MTRLFQKKISSRQIFGAWASNGDGNQATVDSNCSSHMALAMTKQVLLSKFIETSPYEFTLPGPFIGFHRVNSYGLVSMKGLADSHLHVK